MKIVVVISSMVKGGAERVVSNLSVHWAQKHDVRIALFDTREISYDFGGQVVDINAASGRSLLSSLYNPFLRIFRLYRFMKQEKPDMVFSFMESANFPTIIAALLAGISKRVAVSIRNNPESFPKLHQMLMPLLYRIPGRVVPISIGVGNWLEAHGLESRRLKHIPNPICLKMIDRRLAQSDGMAAFQQYTPYLLAVGRLHRQKGFDTLIKAFAMADLKGVKLIILGEGHERKALEGLVRDYALTSRVLLPGIHDNPFVAYQNALCFVMSSRHEGWGNVILEAMSCNCPVISFDCSYGPAEIIEDGKSGLLVKNQDIKALAQAMKRVADNPELRNRLALKGRLRVEEFDIEAVSSVWLGEGSP